MTYLELRKSLKEFTVFSLSDIRKVENDFYRRRLNEWQDKGYIQKVIRGYYIFTDLSLDENALFEIANRIYSPSYISLEMGLSYYHLIPESVYGITSVSTRRTYNFDTSIGKFVYRTIRPSLFFGYTIETYGSKCFKIASLEKTILDYFYFNPELRKESDFAALRINIETFLEQVNEKKFYHFLEKFHSKTMDRKLHSFMRVMKNG